MSSNNDSLFSNPVWDRADDSYVKPTMSRRLYLLLVCFWTTLGIVASAITSQISYGWDLREWNIWGLIGFFLVTFVVAIGGTLIATASDNPLVSLLGYALVAGMFGVMVGPVLALYETSSILKVLFITGAVVIILGLVGALIPDDLSAWGLWLFGGLLFVIGATLVVPLMGFFGLPVEGAMTVVDWIALVVFGGLVIFDLNRAVRLPYTHDNAIDSAMAIYLDFLNIFLRILSLMGQKK